MNLLLKKYLQNSLWFQFYKVIQTRA